MSIGALSARTGVNIETIRYYERIGLVPAPRRSERGRRLYDDDFEHRLRLIRRSRQLGFAIEEIRSLLHLDDHGGANCVDVKEIIRGHLGDIRDKIADLKKIERALTGMANSCEGNQLPGCPVLSVLSKAQTLGG